MRSIGPIRRLVAETRLTVDDLIAPLFVREGLDAARPIASLPGVDQHSIDSLLARVDALCALGVPALILFGVPAHKDEEGSGAWDPDGIVQVAARAIRGRFGDDICLMTDLCVDEYTTHGHCGVLDSAGDVDNDATVANYVKAAVAQARAGAHVVAPSGMMDGQVRAIRSGLDAEGFDGVAIMAYAAKYASACYGPFRDAVDVSIADGGNRTTYQQDPSNRREALVEVALDVAEGADIVMVKPAGPYLDVLADVAAWSPLPVAAYQVSGEYSMVKAADANGWIDGDAVAYEQLVGIKRAGADMILTYFAESVATNLQGERR